MHSSMVASPVPQGTVVVAQGATVCLSSRVMPTHRATRPFQGKVGPSGAPHSSSTSPPESGSHLAPPSIRWGTFRARHQGLLPPRRWQLPGRTLFSRLPLSTAHGGAPSTVWASTSSRFLSGAAVACPPLCSSPLVVSLHNRLESLCLTGTLHYCALHRCDSLSAVGGYGGSSGSVALCVSTSGARFEGRGSVG